MTETELTTVNPGDTVPNDLRAWGLTGQPVSWAPANWQAVVSAIRRVNRGELSPAEAQPILSATFPDQSYDVADVALAHPPVGQFTTTDDGLDVTFDLNGDQDLALLDAGVEWSFGDGSPVVRRAGSHVHTYPAPGTYRARLSVVVAGSMWQTEQDVVVAGGAPPRLTSLEPNMIMNSGDPVVLRVRGTGFTAASVIVFNGGDEPTAFVDETEVTTGVQPATSSGYRTVPVQVRDPGGLSNTLGFDFRGLPVEATEPPEEPEPEPPEEEEYDPSQHTVDEVLAYAAEHPDEVDAILAAEEAGKARVGILDKL